MVESHSGSQPREHENLGVEAMVKRRTIELQFENLGTPKAWTSMSTQSAPPETLDGKMTPGPSALSRIGSIIPALIIAIVYWPTREHGFVWDDGLLSLAGVYVECDLTAIFTTPANSFEYLPVRDLTLCFDHATSGTWAGGFHLQNVAIFGLASILLSVLYRCLFLQSDNPKLVANAPLAALLCALVFVLHPLQVEPVAFITARNALLALLFTLAALTSYLRWLQRKKKFFYFLSIAFVFIALFSKATALPAAGAVVLLDLYFNRDHGLKRSVLRALPHLGATALAAAVHLAIANSHGAMSAAPSIGDLAARLPRAAFIPQFYLYKFFWPFNLSSEYVLSSVKENQLLLGGSALVLSAIAAWLLVTGYRRRTLAGFLCAGFLVALVPILNLFPTYPPVADRYAQIPLLFLAPLAVLPLLNWLPKTLSVGLSLVLAVGLAGLSVAQIPVWKTDESLFGHAAEVNPEALSSLENLAHTHWMRGREQEAIAAFKTLGERNPKDGQHALFSAWHAVRQRDYEPVDELLGEARRLGVAAYYIHMVKGEMYREQGQRSGAVREFRRAKEDAERRFQRDSRARIYLRPINRNLRAFDRTKR
ncbi:MAG: tetratricopeptide (TPR) repeat protein [Myxococcota bacterium]